MLICGTPAYYFPECQGCAWKKGCSWDQHLEKSQPLRASVPLHSSWEYEDDFTGLLVTQLAAAAVVLLFFMPT